MTAPERSTHEVESYHLHKDLGWNHLNPAWAKSEILLGLVAVSSGHLLGVYSTVQYRPTLFFWLLLTASVLLQSLGGYFALAGHRSHLYQSQNKLIAWLAGRIGHR